MPTTFINTAFSLDSSRHGNNLVSSNDVRFYHAERGGTGFGGTTENIGPPVLMMFLEWLTTLAKQMPGHVFKSYHHI